MDSNKKKYLVIAVSGKNRDCITILYILFCFINVLLLSVKVMVNSLLCKINFQGGHVTYLQYVNAKSPFRVVEYHNRKINCLLRK